ncbi:hypothetical protein [Myxococcus landrumensis]|uniref:Lipoprotein n=1 Tax=Myxococcus landrumensis TaxID=2813577 RepID=A0ABX7MXB3_9BACT|nr:hypothetical protein [Myxococcus landrumus]QSQ11087.1 hypothetical protein JY572_21955 [Myxococcus landrumus]
MRRFGWMLGLMGCVGCTTVTRGLATQYNPETGEYEKPKQEVVYLVPVEEAMMTARRILEEDERFDVMEKDGGLELISSLREPGQNKDGLRNLERYYIKGQRLGPRQSLVRVFRLSYSEMENLVEKPTESRGLESFADRAPPIRSAGPAVHVARESVFTKDPLAGAPKMEGFRLARGYRDLDIEQKLLAQLEMAPALELVGGNPPGPMRSMVMEGWGEDEATAAAAPPECGAPLDGASSLFAAGGVLLVADPLGTQEVPAVTLRMMCEATSQGLPVTLALSFPASEQPMLARYLASTGKSTDAQELLSGSTFWRRTYQDGRSSRAMLWLLEQARRLRASGKDVAIAAIDSDKLQGNEREAQMAEHLLQAQAARPLAWTVALTGSVHARTTEVAWNGDLDPMGARVARMLPSVRSLDVSFQRGSQFVCRYSIWDEVECNVFGISPSLEARQSAKQGEGLELYTAQKPDGFHGRLYLGSLNASPPALQAQPRATAMNQAPARK